MASSMGRLFRVTTFGESHGPEVGVVIDGVPPGHRLDLDLVQGWLDRRRPGQGPLSSPRLESDRVRIVSGLEQGVTLGTPLTLMVVNQDQRPGDYDEVRSVLRPSHADFTTLAKYGIRAQSGGGRASARETIGRVAAAAVAEQILAAHWPELRVVAWVDSVKGCRAQVTAPQSLTRAEVDRHGLRCPDLGAADQLAALILAAKAKGDTVGGTIAAFIHGVPPGLGEPVFDKLEADLAKAMLSLPASKGFEVGLGFAATELYGSEHNDAFTTDGAGRIRTVTNHSGGIQGGISNGEAISIRVAFKPVATLFRDQETVDEEGRPLRFAPRTGRHDPCVLPRAVPMVEAMAILVLMDHWLRQEAVRASRGPLSKS